MFEGERAESSKMLDSIKAILYPARVDLRNRLQRLCLGAYMAKWLLSVSERSAKVNGFEMLAVKPYSTGFFITEFSA